MRKVKRLIKDELGEKIMAECTALRLITYGYSIDDGDEKVHHKSKIQI